MPRCVVLLIIIIKCVWDLSIYNIGLFARNRT